jgi:hypothetical protein
VKFTPKFSVRSSSWSIFAGRTDTRSTAGKPNTRWEEGVVQAYEVAQTYRLKRDLEQRLKKQKNPKHKYNEKQSEIIVKSLQQNMHDHNIPDTPPTSGLEAREALPQPTVGPEARLGLPPPGLGSAAPPAHPQQAREALPQPTLGPEARLGLPPPGLGSAAPPAHPQQAVRQSPI